MTPPSPPEPSHADTPARSGAAVPASAEAAVSGYGGHGITEEVLTRIAGAPDPRLREIVSSLVRHLHAFAVDVGLTAEEWQAGVGFLTETGQICDGERQEFVLLSDVLGLSTLVDDLASAPGKVGSEAELLGAATESTILGPFYVPGAPWRDYGDSIVLSGGDSDSGGEPLVVGGTVADTDGKPIEGAVVDVWQTAPNGHYDVQDAEQPRGNFRGRFRTAADGRYRFATVRPVSYPVPDDGPAGRLLRVTGRHPWRPAHIHAIVSAPGHRTLTTTVFDADDPYLGSDAVFGVKDSRVRPFALDTAGTLHLEEHFRLPRA